MKMLCIKGRTHPAHTGLFAGRVYEVGKAPANCCIQNAVHAAGSVFKRPVRLTCIRCGKILDPYVGPVFWKSERFVPFPDADRLGVTEAEVKKLYAPSRRAKRVKEKA